MHSRTQCTCHDILVKIYLFLLYCIFHNFTEWCNIVYMELAYVSMYFRYEILRNINLKFMLLLVIFHARLNDPLICMKYHA